jgi:2-oxoglutarate ferredoxin oxidoreductase subunit alpha
LQEKYRIIEEREIRFESYKTEDADFLLVGFGMCSRLLRSAAESLAKAGIKAGLFRPISLWPFPYQALKAAARGKKKILVVEMNAGQMVEDVRLAVSGAVPVDFLGRMGGMVPEVESIVERVKGYVE